MKKVKHYMNSRKKRKNEKLQKPKMVVGNNYPKITVLERYFFGRYAMILTDLVKTTDREIDDHLISINSQGHRILTGATANRCNTLFIGRIE